MDPERSPSGRPPPRESSRRRRRRRWRWIALAVLLGGLLAGVGLRPGWRLVKTLRAARFSRQAVALETQEQWLPALGRARAALQLDPANTRALRVIAALVARAGDEAALRYYDALLARPDATASDREDCVAFALAVRQADLAGVHLAVLRSAASPSPRTLALAAVHELLLGHPAAAAPLAREAVRRDPENPTNTLTLASILLASSAPTDRDEARTLLWPIAGTNGPLQLEALGTLVNSPESPRADREKAFALLVARTNATFNARLLAYKVQLSLDPSRGRELARELVTRVRPADDPQLALLAGWLVENGFADEALPLFAGDRVHRNRELFLARYRALLAAGDLAKAYDFLFTPESPIEPCELEQLRCRTADLRHDNEHRDAHLDRAVKLAGTDLRRVASVSRLAETYDRTAAAVAVWQPLLQQPALAPTALRQLVRLVSSQGDTRGARENLRRLVRHEPGNASVRLALAHADLLRGENLAESTAEATRQLEQNPGSPEARTIAALGHLRQGDASGASLLVQGMVIRPEATAPSLLVIVAAVLDAGGERDKAREVVLRTRLTALRPEERELIRPLLLRDTPLATPVPGG